ncbi:hypothetical protein CASFOL_012848 [Castilleja foliolosa]|uniref:Chitin synthase export chaperone n=1 Tax=Castilleja foliolosa TaxID=1961234 RepID=A0ABD3DIU3_9LAMI
MAIPENKTDIETGNPGILDYPQTRGDFIFKFYFTLFLQVFLTNMVYLAMSQINPVREFMGTAAGLHLLCHTTAITFISLILMIMFRKRHPYNYVLLFLYTLALSFTVGGFASQIDGEIVFHAMSGALITMHSLSYFAVVTAKQGREARDSFCFGPFKFFALLLLILLSVVTSYFPNEKTLNDVYNFLGLVLWIPIFVDCCLNVVIDLFVMSKE